MYGSLAPGQYRFLVRAVNSAGMLSPQTARLTFRVLQPLWARWWFLVFAAAGLGSILYGLHRLRVRQLLALEQVRMTIATDLHDDIGASLSQIAILS